MDIVSGRTKVICIFGSPIAQAMSPSLHNASFQQLGVDCVCIAADVRPEGLKDAVQGARVMGFSGLIVTMPDKTGILQYLDELSPAAELMGAVNTVVRDGDRLIGHNTDGAGFMRAVALAGVDVIGKKMTLIGGAGAGQLAKSVNQICIAGIVQGLAEGLYFAEKAGLDPARVIEAISGGAAQSWQMENRWKTMVEGHYTHGFAVDWMRKDLRITLEAARENGASLPMTATVDQYYADVQAMGGNRWDTSSLLARLKR